ncbi:DEAD/DEAH box helicase [Mycoplasmopsis gallinarum]|uniref:DEAD/DEAH box helicase n=1 Tax=Mycoplasmopsis gallinarum TaxID=29557 RepID=UPI000481EFC7|nr:DEAD/DEAH box helicase family protein [Mycoplasmopsis gallinarum]
MKLTKVQEKAVNQIVSCFDPLNKSKVIFKAPTGAGKTFMIANVIDRIINQRNGKKLIFVLATISDASLPQQLETHIRKYLPYLNNSFEIKYIVSPSSSKTGNKVKDYTANIPLMPNGGLLIFGLASFGKNRIFTEEGILDTFIDNVKNSLDAELIYIRDEAHRANDAKRENSLNKDTEKANEKLKNAAHFYIEMTATPKNINDSIIVEITEKELREDETKLLKERLLYNEGIDDIKEEEIENSQLLEKACQKFKEIKEDYVDKDNKYGLKGINPAMLIQVENKTKENEEEFNKQIELIIRILKKYHLNWVTYFSDDKKDSSGREEISLDKISKNNSDIDVIIFKVGPSVGWDIPRACMLVQLRNVSSETLSIQTVGRIKRNPAVKGVNNENWDTKNPAFSYYIYSYSRVPSIEYLASFSLKTEYKNIDFISGVIDKNQYYDFKRSSEYRNRILNLISKDQLQEQCNLFIDEYKEKSKIIFESEKLLNTNKRIISKAIFNTIDLALANENLIEKQKNYWNLNLKNEVLNQLKQVAKELKINPELVIYAFFTLKKSEIRQIYLNFQEQKHQNQLGIDYKIIKAKLPDFVPIEKDNFNNNWNVFRLENNENLNLKSAYENAYISKETQWIAETSTKENFFVYTSNPEKSFLKKLRSFLNKKPIESNSISVWAINPVYTGIYFEYIDGDIKEIRKSFPDYLIKIKDHLVAIEVKSTNDYDLKKTTKIEKGYKEFLHQKNLKIFEDSFTLVIYKPEEDEFSGMSTIENVNKKIAEYDSLSLFLNDIIKELN